MAQPVTGSSTDHRGIFRYQVSVIALMVRSALGGQLLGTRYTSGAVKRTYRLVKAGLRLDDSNINGQELGRAEEHERSPGAIRRSSILRPRIGAFVTACFAPDRRINPHPRRTGRGPR